MTSTSISLLGIKIGMTQIFSTTGNALPVTVIKLGPCIITQIKNKESDKYNAIQIGYLEIPKHKLSNGAFQHLNKSGIPALKYLEEHRLNFEPCKKFQLGQQLTTNDLQIGYFIDVTSKKIGKGFTGYQKRHKFTRGPMSHGSKNHRQPGSIGAGTTPGRVFPGKKMAGRMGATQVTIKNLEILDIKHEEHLIIVKGSVPGKPGSLISITTK